MFYIYVHLYIFRQVSRAVVCAHAAFDPHEIVHHILAVRALPLHGVGLGFVRHATSTALARRAVLGPVLLHARATVVRKLDGLALAPRVLTLLALLQCKHTNTTRSEKD